MFQPHIVIFIQRVLYPTKDGAYWSSKATAQPGAKFYVKTHGFRHNIKVIG